MENRSEFGFHSKAPPTAMDISLKFITYISINITCSADGAGGGSHSASKVDK